jgi:membrane-bound serine protease (ClpP class)
MKKPLISVIILLCLAFGAIAAVQPEKQAKTAALKNAAASVSGTVKPAPAPVKKPAASNTAPETSLSKTFYCMNVEGIIDIANADYVVKGIDQAEKDGAQGVIITMQTPGGLDASMRKICKKMLETNVPCVVYVSPKGSRAASAGAFITLASHVAAMAEGTNIGTAHPVDYNGSAVSEKITNDAVAYIKNLARLRGRNEQWASDAILKNVSSSELDALKLHVIDIIAKDKPELMAKLDKRIVTVADKKVKLNTKDYVLTDIKPTSKHAFLHMLSDPNIVYVLFLLGIYGLIYELAHAGTVVFPGIAGAIALVLAFTGFESLPINTAGAILIALSAFLFFIELVNPAHGALALGGVISLTLGSFLLFPGRSQGSAWAVSYFLMAGMIILTVAFFTLVVAAVLKALKKKSIIGVQSLVGLNGVAKTEVFETGVVNVGGEEWQAYSDEKISVRDLVQVLEVNGMKLKVKKIERKKEE